MPFQPKQRVIAVNASGGALVSIPASVLFKRMLITETPDPNVPATFNPQGIVYQTSRDGFVASFVLLPGEDLVIEDSVLGGSGGGRTISAPAIPMPNGNTRTADVVVKVISATATATQVLVREWV